MLNYQPTYHDETLDPLIQQILPDIEQSLKKQLMDELQREAQIQFEKELARVEQQAIEEYELAMHDLEEEGRKLFKEQTDQLKKEIERLEREKKSKEDGHMKHLQDRFISQNFQQLILTHPKIQQIQNELALEILTNSQQKIQATKQRRIRELAVKMQNKEQKYKKDRDRAIKNQIYQDRSVDELKRDLQMMKIGIASMKSEYNIKIKKLDGEIKAIKQKNKAIQPKDNVAELRKELERLQNKRDEFNEKVLYEQKQNENKMRINDTFSHLDCSTEQVHQPPHAKSLETMLQREHVVVEDDDYSQSRSDSSEERDDSYSNEGIANPPTYHLPVDESDQNLKTYESHAPILKLNVASLLRANWQDPLQKYISDAHNNRNQIYEQTDTNNENDSKMGNKSSFQQIYHQHLEKLNQATKRRKLSAQAKRTIMKNLSMMRKNKL